MLSKGNEHSARLWPVTQPQRLKMNVHKCTYMVMTVAVAVARADDKLQT